MSQESNAVLSREEAALFSFKWLLDSGIQDLSKPSSLWGGVNAWFDLRDQSYSFIYGEITGYAINAFLYAHSLTGRNSYMDAACKAADWLLENSYPENGLVRNRVNQTGFEIQYYDNWVFTFDQWIMVYSLACLYDESKNPQYLEKAVSMAEFLLNKTQKQDGSFWPVWNLETGVPEGSGDKWSRQSGGYHAKALMALDRLYQLTQNEIFLNSGSRLCDWTLKQQCSDGRFITQANQGSTHLHPHLYALEGLLVWGISRKENRLLEAVQKGVEWILVNSGTGGKVLSFYTGKNFLPFVRVDILAQTLRIARLLESQGIALEGCNRLEAITEEILAYQMTHAPQLGGFLYGQEQDGKILYHVNSWVSMFAAQALSLDGQPGSLQSHRCLSFFI